MKKKTFPLIYATLILCLGLTAIFIHRYADTFFFHGLTKQFFTDSLENDALTLHYTLADPEAYGIHSKSSALPVYSCSAQEHSFSTSRQFLAKLSGIRPDKLSKDDRFTYELLSSYIGKTLEGAAYPYYEEPLSPTSGMHTELPLLLAEYTFRTVKDAENYLDLLESIPAYLEGLAVYEAEKAQVGLFMPQEDAFAVAGQCSQLFSDAALQNGSHFLLTTFTDKLIALADSQQITSKQQSAFSSRNLRLLTTVVSPAYQKLGDTLIVLSQYSTEKGGLCQFPEGKEYYAWLTAHTTGCSMPPDELYILLKTKLVKDYERLLDLAGQYRSLTGTSPDFTLLNTAFSTTDPSEILSDLQTKMAQDFPALSDLSEENISCTIKNVDKALEPFTSPAYYMTPPVDDPLHNTICINRSSTAEGVELYTTLAHEGYPGHLYQTVYSALSSDTQQTPVRELLYFGGYTEGWAYYTERLSYTYASQLLTAEPAHPGASAAAGLALNPSHANVLLCELAASQRDLQINFFCMLDISLHYLGTSQDKLLENLAAFGIEGESALQILDYVRTSPASYLKYYVGYLEIMALRQKARELWGDSFTLLRFHTFILENGPADFSTLYERLITEHGDQQHHSSSILSIYPLSQSRIFNFFAAATAGSVKY